VKRRAVAIDPDSTTTSSLLKQRKPTRRDPELMKALILTAARDEFVEHGLSGARVDRIAARAQAGKNLIYYYFGDKEALYLAVIEEIYREMRTQQGDDVLPHLSPIEGMRRLVGTTFDHFVRTPALTRLMSVENIHYAKYLKSSTVVRGLYGPLLANMQSLLDRGQAEGVFRADVDPIDLYISISGLAYFYLSNRYTLSWIFDQDLAEPARLAQRKAHIVDVVLGYLRPVPEVGPLEAPAP
jgi:TetR/AcrR family transcriptional regulator